MKSGAIPSGERAEGNCALGIGAIVDKNMDTMDDVIYS
jgi:hypothetical protein